MSKEIIKGTYTNARGEQRDLRELSLLSTVDMINLAHPNCEKTVEEVIDEAVARNENKA